MNDNLANVKARWKQLEEREKELKTAKKLREKAKRLLVITLINWTYDFYNMSPIRQRRQLKILKATPHQKKSPLRIALKEGTKFNSRTRSKIETILTFAMKNKQKKQKVLEFIQKAGGWNATEKLARRANKPLPKSSIAKTEDW